MKAKIAKTKAHLKAFYGHNFSRINSSPVIVLGHQKAGTSAIAALLAKATDKTVTIDFFHKNYIRTPMFRERLAARDLSFADFVKSNKLYFSSEIIKEPELTFYYEELSNYFPKAQFIFVIRDPRDTIRSILNRLHIPGDLDHLGGNYYESIKLLEGWKSALTGQLPNVPGENYVEKLAYRWNLAAKTYLDSANTMALIKYEDFKSSKVGSIQELALSVGLPIKTDISDAVDIQFQPRGNSSVSLVSFFGKANLLKIETICQEMMSHFEYKSQEPYGLKTY